MVSNSKHNKAHVLFLKMQRSSRQGKAEKRRKTAKECPNPLFLKWLERWRDEAKAKESKLQYVYNKAISSLKKYPLPLESGQEAMILDGIGPGIAKRLDEELGRHNRDFQNNVVLEDDDIGESDFPDLRVPPPPSNMVATSPVVNGTPHSSEEPKPKEKRKSSPREYIPLYRSGPYAMMIALLKASERIGYKGYLTKNELQQQAQPYSETSFTVPEPDSYYTAWSSMSTLTKKGFVVKSGNPARFSLTDAGFSLANKLTVATATHNSTVSSPSHTLPHLPTTSFSPPTTSVPKPRTPSTPRGASKPRTPTASPQTIRSPPTTPIINLATDQSTSPFPRYGNRSKDFLASFRYKTTGTEVPQCQLGCLEFWYIGSDGECVEDQDKAAVIVDDEISFGFLAKCRQSDLDKEKVKYKADASRPSKDGYVFVYIASESIARLSEAARSNTSKGKKSPGIKTLNVSDDDSDDEMLMRPLFERLGGCKNDNEKKTKPGQPLKRGNATTLSKISPEILTITDCTQAKVTVSSQSHRNHASISNLSPPSLTAVSESIPVKPSSSKTQPSHTRQTTQVTKTGTKEKQPNHTIKPIQTKRANEAEPATNQAKQNINPPKESDTLKKVEKVIRPEYELKAGSYEIILCVDFVETTGGSKTGRKEEMVKELRMNGVYFDVRKLNVGDFLWVAREKMLPVPGQLVLPERRELVLDYIVERKRMDDLCSSIKDGRFKEQKFRLLNSGLRHPVYLVEDFGSMSFMSMPAQTLEQAIANTQIGQEFFVKRTGDIKESAAYLTLMTRYLQTAYKDQTLKAITKDDMEHVKVDENQVNTFLMTFQQLNDISIKNRVLTVGELFGKQLLQIPGVAAEKVVGILEHYSTLRDLLDAYEEQTTEKEKQNLLSDIKFGKTQRKIGPSVSKTVYQLYCTKGALS